MIPPLTINHPPIQLALLKSADNLSHPGPGVKLCGPPGYPSYAGIRLPTSWVEGGQPLLWMVEG